LVSLILVVRCRGMQINHLPCAAYSHTDIYHHRTDVTSTPSAGHCIGTTSPLRTLRRINKLQSARLHNLENAWQNLAWARPATHTCSVTKTPNTERLHNSRNRKHRRAAAKPAACMRRLPIWAKFDMWHWLNLPHNSVTPWTIHSNNFTSLRILKRRTNSANFVKIAQEICHCGAFTFWNSVKFKKNCQFRCTDEGEIWHRGVGRSAPP